MLGLGQRKTVAEIEREKREQEQRNRIDELLLMFEELEERYEAIKCQCPHSVHRLSHYLVIDGDAVEYNRNTETKLLDIVHSMKFDIDVQEKAFAERQAAIIAEREVYKNKYYDLSERIYRVGGKLKLKKKQAMVKLPRLRKIGYHKWGMYYNEYDYVYVCTKLVAVERVHAERKAALENDAN